LITEVQSSEKLQAEADQKLDIQSILDDDLKRKQYNQMKEIYYDLPKSSDSLKGIEINYDVLIEKNLFDTAIKDFIFDINAEYLGENDQESSNLIDWIIKNLKMKAPFDHMKQ